jgi:hypothetical protein
MVTIVRVRPSPRPEKKWRATFYGPTQKSVDFGLKGFSDYTIHKDHARMLRYIGRHRRRENWSPSGKYTAGFWSRWLLWSEPSFRAAKRRTQKVLGPGYKII